MKTKTKIILHGIICITYLCAYESTQAYWYGNHTKPKSGDSTNCTADSQTDSLPPSNSQGTGPAGDTGFIYYNGQTQVIGDNGGSITCQYWDSTIPIVSNLTYHDGWTNNTNITISWAGSDFGGSGMDKYELQVYRVSGAQGTPITLLETKTTSSTSYNYVGGNGYAYKFAVIPYDNAGNIGSPLSSSYITRIDTVVPITTSLVSNTPANLLATTSQAFTFSYPNDGGSEIRIISDVESYLNPSNWISIFNPSGFGWTFTSNQNISKVDGSDRVHDSGTARDYIYRVTQICDKANNCWNGSQDYTFHVYANPNELDPTISNTSDSSQLNNGVSDGVERKFIHIIKDKYENAIIPASGIGREVRLNLNSITNSMYLDQHTRTGPTSVYVTASNNINEQSLPLNNTQLHFTSPLSSSDGRYETSVKVYTPTANGYLPQQAVSDPDAGFEFDNNLVVSSSSISGDAGGTFIQSLSNPNFKPLYRTEISGDLRDGGFIEGTEQTNIISVVSNNTNNVTPIGVDLQLEFGGINKVNFDLFAGSMINPPTPITFRSTINSNPGVSPSSTLYTRLMQKPSITVSNLSNLQLSTHFSYSLDGKNIVYNSDLIGNEGYWSTVPVPNLGNQYGVKVLGTIKSKSIMSIVDSQFSAGSNIFGEFSDNLWRDDINKKVALAIRNMRFIPVGNSLTDVGVLPNDIPSTTNGGIISLSLDNSIIKLQKSGGFITLASTSGITGKRTIVIEGADLFITQDMYYADNKSILGIVLQKDKDGRGGNLYIKPDVTNIVGTFILDGSIMSSENGTSPIGISNITTLKNQLHIYGTIVSENTLGGSRMNPPRCPSILSVSCGTVEEAQKYDLNYLRRYYVFNGQPFGNAKIIGGETCPGGVCTNINTHLIQKFSTMTNNLSQHPVIIEYNPYIQENPPIGF